MTAQQQRLVRFIEEHGHSVRWNEEHSDIRALDVWTYCDDAGVQHVGEEWTTVEPTWAAVREWLGY